MRWLRPQDVVVEATALHNRTASLHGNPKSQVHAQYLTVESPSHDVGFHGDEGVLHGEAALFALTVRLAMVQTSVVLVRLCWRFRTKLVLYAGAKVAVLVIHQVCGLRHRTSDTVGVSTCLFKKRKCSLSQHFCSSITNYN